METFTISDVLMNSTDLNKILCNFGIRNLSECEGEEESSSEPKGRVTLSTVRVRQTLRNTASE